MYTYAHTLRERKGEWYIYTWITHVHVCMYAKRIPGWWGRARPSLALERSPTNTMSRVKIIPGIWGSLVTCVVLFARAPVFGLCFFVSMWAAQARPSWALGRSPRNGATIQPVESWFGPKRGFRVTPGELLAISKPNLYPKSEKPPAQKGFTKPNLWNPLGRFDGPISRSKESLAYEHKLVPVERLSDRLGTGQRMISGDFFSFWK